MVNSSKEAVFQNKFENRPWGKYEILLSSVDLKVKKITVNPGERLSLQRHQRRDEHWFICSGEAVVEVGEKIIKMSLGDSVDIKKNIVHRVKNSGSVGLVFIEVQTGDYFGEDDIERLEDDYNRDVR
jgi:mannose-6-phosphate isomerase